MFENVFLFQSFIFKMIINRTFGHLVRDKKMRSKFKPYDNQTDAYIVSSMAPGNVQYLFDDSSVLRYCNRLYLR